MPLLDNDEHKRLHGLGPKDVYWGKYGAFKKQTVVMSYQVTRSTIDNEQVSFSVPVFAEDTREQIKDRLGFAYSVVQDRLDESSKAWAIAADKAEADAKKRAEEKKK